MTLKLKLPIIVGIIIAVFGLLSIPQSAQIQPEQRTNLLHSPHAGKDWDQQKIAHESRALHEFNRQRLARVGIEADKTEAVVTDTNDVSVIQDDGTIIIPPTPFSLVGRSVLFTPTGAGYSISGSTATYDTNLGTKLDLAVAPAVNPKIPSVQGVEAGDDAYLVQDLGFNFSFYGTSYANVAISSNGNMTFRPTGTDNKFFDDSTVDSGESLAVLQSALPRISPYWHDLDARTVATQGANGIYIRKASDRVLISWNNINDFFNRSGDNGTHRFQVTLFNDGRIQIVYGAAQLTTTALVGISAGGTAPAPTLVNFASPTVPAANTPFAQYFSTTQTLDELNAIKAFYNAHPNQDVYDFAYVVLDFNYTLPGNAFAYYSPIRNNVSGINQDIFDSDTYGALGGKRIMGFLNMSNILTQYPEYPTTRFLGANHALSIFGQEQGHAWLAYVLYPGRTSTVLLGRDLQHWNFFFNSESSLSQPAAPRSSSSEGNVWRDNGNGTFTTISLIDGYSKLDHYLMGLRPPEQVPDSFLITNVFGTTASASSNPAPSVQASGIRQAIPINQIISANGQREPSVANSTKNYRAACLIITQKGQAANPSTINKLTRYRLAWESYFAQSTDYLATINTGISALSSQRFIGLANGASYTAVLSPGVLTSIFGQGLTNGASFTATPGQALPFNLGGIEVKVDGIAAPLFYVGQFQINFQMPRTVQATTFISTRVDSATATVEIFKDGLLIRAAAPQIAPVLPGIFSLSQDGAGPAAALDAINFSAAPFNAKQANGQPNFVALFASGLGADVTDVDGNVNGSVQVTLNGTPTTVSYAGRAPGYFGLNQINFQLPVNIAAGTYNAVIARNGIASNSVTIAIK